MASPTPTPSAPTSAPMASNVAGLLCYVPVLITGIIMLLIEPYKNDKFVRFHAFQSIFFGVFCIAFWMLWSFVVVGLLFTGGVAGFGIFGMLFWLIRLAFFGLWIFLVYKAYNNEQFKLPVIGDLAAKQAAA
jgi:uncharacterized membrane protein